MILCSLPFYVQVTNTMKLNHFENLIYASQAIPSYYGTRNFSTSLKRLFSLFPYPAHDEASP